MKVSEISESDLLLQIREVKEDLTEAEISHIMALRDSAVAYVESHTGLPKTSASTTTVASDGTSTTTYESDCLDAHEDVTMAVLALVSDMYDNRQMTVDSSNSNRLVESILSLHSVNLIPGESS